MMGRLRAAALLLALGAACTRGEEQDGESGICRHLPQAYCRDDRPVTTRCQYESIAYCIEYVPKGELVAAPDEAKRLCEEVPYLDATGRFEAGDCPGGAVGRCTSEPSYGRRDYYYVGFGGFEDPDQVAMVASVICDHEWEELAP